MVNINSTKKNVTKKEIVSPGHVFPIISKDGGVLVRAGHTEASVDISKRVSDLNDDELNKIRDLIDKDYSVEGDLRRW